MKAENRDKQVISEYFEEIALNQRDLQEQIQLIQSGVHAVIEEFDKLDPKYHMICEIYREIHANMDVQRQFQSFKFKVDYSMYKFDQILEGKSELSHVIDKI